MMIDGLGDATRSKIPPMTVTAIAPWFGGKRTMAPKIVQQLGRHRAYWEPFCGSLAVLFAKPPSSHETVCDLHGDLVNLARVVASDRWEELYGRLSRTLYSDDLFGQAKERFNGEEPAPPGDDERTVSGQHLERAYWYFIMVWMGRNGTAGSARANYQMALRWTASGGSGPVRWCAATESIAAWHERLRNVIILRRDAFQLLEKIDDAPVHAIYCDPPYLMSTRGTGGGSRYKYDFKPEDHERLAAALRRFTRARVVVSYYADHRLAEWYPGWTQIDCERHKHLHVQSARGSKRTVAPEVLLVNGPAYAEEGTGVKAVGGKKRKRKEAVS